MVKHHHTHHGHHHQSSSHHHGSRSHFGASSVLDMDTSEQELMLRSWRRDGRTIAMGAAAGVLVLVLIAVTAALLSGGPGVRGQREEYVSMVEVLGLHFDTRPFNGTWIGDSLILYQNRSNYPILFDLTNCSFRSLIKHNVLKRNYNFMKYELSADHKFLLGVHNVHKMPLSRYMFEAQYELINLEKQSTQPLGPPGRRLLDLVVWAPVGNSLVYVYHNDIYYRPQADDEREIRITNTGKPLLVHNGVPDWSYQEEILHSNIALWFSPDGKKLAYASFNDTNVGVVPIPYYDMPDDLYPRVLNVHYPKPNSSIPQVSLFVEDLEKISSSNHTAPISILPPQEMQNGNHILGEVQWYSNTHFAAMWSNRLQNTVKVMSHSASDGSSLEQIKSLERCNSWIDPGTRLHFSANGSLALLVASSDRDFSQILRIKLKSPEKPTKELTGDHHHVSRILAWDEPRHLIYFLGTTSSQPSQQHIYQILDTPRSDGKYNQPICVSCLIPLVHSTTPCQHASASFSPSNSFYMMVCNGPEVPEISLFSQEHQRVVLWEDNRHVRTRIANKLLPVPCPTTVLLPDGHEAVVRMWLPPNYDISKSKYPLLIDVDGAPGSRRISDRFHVDWHVHLVANRSIVYAIIEGRGARMQGDRGRSADHHRIGAVEVEDQIYVVKELIKRYNYIDGAKVGVWGWSYGGYTAAMVLANDSGDLFKCGIAVAPIVSWKHYNALFTERYMHLPTVDDNLEGYNEADLTSKAERLSNKKLLIMHGTMDTIVHYHHSMLLVQALRRNNVPFQMHTYPGEMHGLHGVRSHVYRTMEKYLENCFPLD